MNENLMLAGRLRGGGAILWSSLLKYKIRSTECKSERLCCILVILSSHVTLIILNVYMPYDEIKNKRYNCKIHGLYTGAMYIQTNVSSS